MIEANQILFLENQTNQKIQFVKRCELTSFPWTFTTLIMMPYQTTRKFNKTSQAQHKKNTYNKMMKTF